MKLTQEERDRLTSITSTCYRFCEGDLQFVARLLLKYAEPQETCAECRGLGYWPPGGPRCKSCGGTGKVG